MVRQVLVLNEGVISKAKFSKEAVTQRSLLRQRSIVKQMSVVSKAMVSNITEIQTEAEICRITEICSESEVGSNRAEQGSDWENYEKIRDLKSIAKNIIAHNRYI